MSSVAFGDSDQQETLPGSEQKQHKAPWEGACGAIVPSCCSARWPPPVSLHEESWPCGEQDVSVMIKNLSVLPPSCLTSAL